VKDYLDLVALQVVAATDAPGRHAFVALFDGPRGQQQATVTPEALTDYGAFQREVLAATGCMFRHFLADPMPREAANATWRSYVDSHLAAYWRLAQGSAATVN
jgi:hypothetical protein